MIIFLKSNTIVSILFVLIYFQSIIVRIQSVSSKGKFNFGPNQLASNIWYKSKGHLINDQHENSYSNFNLWSNLLLHLQNNNGSISTQASKIGYMMNFRKNNISIIALLSVFTQCHDDRQDSNGKGWFVTREINEYIKRNPPQWLYPNLSWADRKTLARVDNCPQADIQHLKDLVELLCSVNNCPEVVYMDMDLTYITSYSLEVLHMTISFGINLVDQCVEIDNCVAEILSTDHSQFRCKI
ncbi:unnamed protein product [Adineta steineri]|uniref:Uncharacterized protein n=1 Tax=Adineta steineri TaxID=433720 RepID=A0A820BEF7_9BILA|nr:unnamed protein product [Adineta steineri]